MAVVINEVEVVDTPVNDETRTAARSNAPATKDAAPREEDLRRALAEIAEHALRTWSH